MAVITIPIDYEAGDQRSEAVVPICVSETDEAGRMIAPDWIRAVVPVADYLRKLAARRLRDVWRVSELAELAVRAQWRKHGDDVGICPHQRLATYARWKVEDLRCGHVRLRKHLDVLLGDGDKTIVDPVDYQSRMDSAHDVEQIRDRLERLVSKRAAATFQLLVVGHCWKEIALSFGLDESERTLNTLRKRHARAISRALGGLKHRPIR